MSVGETFLSDEPIEINVGRRTARLRVANTGDRPIQIGSHYHFFETNRALRFDRPAAFGMHLDIPPAPPSGSSPAMRRTSTWSSSAACGGCWDSTGW